MTTTIRTFAAAAAIALLVGCGDNSVTPPDEPSLVVSAGNNQQGLPSAALSQQLQVRVHEGGDPVSGITVTWAVTSGGGTVQPVSTTTDAQGHASAVWILGPTIGTNMVVASSAGAQGEATFTAEAVEEVGAVLVAEVPIAANYGIHDTFVRDGIAFVAAWNSGIRIYDVGGGSLGGSPSAPQLIGQYTPPTGGVPGGAQVHNSWWFHNPTNGEKKYLFVGQEGPSVIGLNASGDLKVFDVTNLATPTEVATLRIPDAGVHNFWMDEAQEILYAAWYNGGVVAVDVSGTLQGNLSNRIIGQAYPGGVGNAYTWGVMLSGGTLYAADMLNGFFAIDPATMTPKHATPNVTNRFTSDLWVHGNVGYTGTWGARGGNPGNTINVWSLGGGGAPTFVRAVELQGVGTVSDVAVTPDGGLLVATAEGGAGNGLHLFGRTNPLEPVALAQVIVPQGLHTGEVAVINGRTYVFAARNPPNPALMIFDITDVNP